ncbi:transcriptional regulator, TraR/DksA family [Desulfomonile tiedjei DSM 6799]|uniref:RNA polymerase-binding transcription factor DksA n=2 Tax=Desulfomonile tiedjei TaxID=2358 RepID=I4C6P5_DESTA|nr:transcriptional regulator, TraR/DksA family [Desulfomonile tiedjei DSM 6799]
MKMKKEDLEYFQGILQKQLDDLVRGAGRTVDDMTEIESKSSFPDPTDRAALESDRNFELRIRDRERKLINKIRKALDKIEDGSFGFCEVCGEPIEFKRLEARPVTTHCIECKTTAEEEEKIRRL